MTASLLAPQLARGVVVDDFSDATATGVRENLEQRGKGSKALRDSEKLRGVLGGTRQLIVRVENPVATSDSINLWVDRSAKRLSYASSGGADGAFEMVYDGGGRGLRADFSSEKGITIGVEADVSSVPYSVTLGLTDLLGRRATATRTVSVPGAQQIEFPFAGMRISTDRIARISFVIDPRAASDIEVSRIETWGPTAGNRRGR